VTVSKKTLEATASARVYAQDFNTFLSGHSFDGWVAAGTAGAAYASATPGLTGTSNDHCIGFSWTPTAGQTVILQRTVTGLVAGWSYTLTAWAAVDDEGGVSFSETTFSIGVEGVGSSATVAQSKPGGGFFTPFWSQFTYTFTATAESHVIELIGTVGTGTDTIEIVVWDAVQLTVNVDIDPESGSVTLDEGWAPYGQGQLTIPIPDTATLQALDPRGNPTCNLIAGQSKWDGTGWTDPMTRAMGFLIRQRQVDHNAETVSLTLATRDALLQDYRLVATTPDTSFLAHQSSLRTVVNEVLAVVTGDSLEPGTVDADFTTLTQVTNLAPHIAPRIDTSGWVAGGSGGTLTRVAGSPPGVDVGGYFYRFTAGSSASLGLFNQAGEQSGAAAVNVTPNDLYTFSMWVRASVACTVSLRVEWTDSSSANIGETTSTDVALAANTWTRIQQTYQAPATAAHAGTFIYRTNASWAAGNTLDAAGLLVTVGTTQLETDGTPLKPFDGATATTPNYTYAWAAAAYGSSATRTPRFDRTPDALTWQPGQTALDFLSGPLQVSGLRLFCDELGVWRMVDSSYALPGRVTVAEGFNAYRATDTIGRDQTADDGSPLWFDACVIKYSWIDSNGAQQVAYDSYAAPGSTQAAYFERSTAFPGPGTAEYYVRRVNGHGRALSLTAAVDYTAAPGMEVSASLPGTEDQTGRVSSVAWDFQADEMTVGTRGLVDTPESAWIELNPGESWLDSPTGADWISEVV
jgi:hypothetical protein